MSLYYDHGGIQIWHGDCRLVLPDILGGFELLLTDPPYGIEADRDRDCAKNGWVDYGLGGWDSIPADAALIRMVMARANKHVIWGGNYFALPPSMGWLVWDKGQRDFSLADGELAWTSENRALRIFSFSRAAALQDGRRHPTQKPLALMKWCISMFPEAKSLLDPFCGSGTSLLAAKTFGIAAVGIDSSEKCCEIAAQRLSQEVFDFASDAATAPR